MKPFSRKVNLTISLRYIQSLSFEKGKKKKKVLDPFPSHWCLHYHAWRAAYFLTKTHFVKKMHACPTTKKNMKEIKQIKNETRRINRKLRCIILSRRVSHKRQGQKQIKNSFALLGKLKIQIGKPNSLKSDLQSI